VVPSTSRQIPVIRLNYRVPMMFKSMMFKLPLKFITNNVLLYDSVFVQLQCKTNIILAVGILTAP